MLLLCNLIVVAMIDIDIVQVAQEGTGAIMEMWNWKTRKTVLLSFPSIATTLLTHSIWQGASFTTMMQMPYSEAMHYTIPHLPSHRYQQPATTADTRWDIPHNKPQVIPRSYTALLSYSYTAHRYYKNDLWASSWKGQTQRNRTYDGGRLSSPRIHCVTTNDVRSP